MPVRVRKRLSAPLREWSFRPRGNDANENDGIKSAKEHLRQLVDQAWRSKNPYVGKKGHKRCIQFYGFTDLQRRGVAKPMAIQAIREMVEDGEINIKRQGPQGYAVPRGEE